MANCHYAKFHHSECHYAECRYNECRGALVLIAMLLCHFGILPFLLFIVFT
jgi:hypothetical protein